MSRTKKARSIVHEGKVYFDARDDMGWYWINIRKTPDAPRRTYVNPVYGQILNREYKLYTVGAGE